MHVPRLLFLNTWEDLSCKLSYRLSTCPGASGRAAFFPVRYISFNTGRLPYRSAVSKLEKLPCKPSGNLSYKTQQKLEERGRSVNFTGASPWQRLFRVKWIFAKYPKHTKKFGGQGFSLPPLPHTAGSDDLSPNCLCGRLKPH
jgi:hypothetical protein